MTGGLQVSSDLYHLTLLISILLALHNSDCLAKFGLTNECELYFSDLGAQAIWTIVFLVIVTTFSYLLTGG